MVSDTEEDGTDCDGDDGTTSSTEPTVPSPSPSAAAGSFQLNNKLSAQKLNKQFESLTAASSCTDGQNACIQGQFAQCVGGKFTLSACGSSLMCVALPLVNSLGTVSEIDEYAARYRLTHCVKSITCDTQADAEARIGGGITGD